MHVTIITGASRGLGLAVTEALLQRGHHVLALARGATEPASAASTAGRLEAWRVDLADAEPVAARLQGWIGALPAAQVDSLTLINNAGVVSQPAMLSALPLATLKHDLRVGLESALLLTGAFLAASRGWTAPRKLLMVSSGLGRRAMAGGAVYCAAKAGMDHLARALALEEAAQPHGARVVSLAPGIIDTGMQVTLRGADRALFPEGERFAQFKAAGQLDSPEAAAAKLLRYLDRPDFGSNPVADVRDA